MYILYMYILYMYIYVHTWYSLMMLGWSSCFIISTSLATFFKFSESKRVLSMILIATCTCKWRTQLLQCIVYTHMHTHICTHIYTCSLALPTVGTPGEMYHKNLCKANQKMVAMWKLEKNDYSWNDTAIVAKYIPIKLKILVHIFYVILCQQWFWTYTHM